MFPYFKRGCALCLKRRVDTTSQGWSVIDVSIVEYTLCIREVNPMSQGKVNPTSLGSVPYVSSECTLCLKERSLCLGYRSGTHLATDAGHAWLETRDTFG